MLAMPFASADGNSMVVDWKGQVLSESNGGETFTAFGEIDLEALRAARRKPGMTNYLARQRTEMCAAAYGAVTVHPAGTLLERPADRDHFTRVQNEVIERLAKDSPLPLNLMASANTPVLDVLARAGVARLSHGPGPYAAAMKALEAQARATYTSA